MTLQVYKPGTAFPGVIGRTVEQSSPAWPQPERAKEGAPNVLFIVLDDLGFGQLGCYGAPIRTPNLDALAAGGLRYNNFHTTALCSPTRACIITGRNHHSNGLAWITEGATGYPGSNGIIPFDNGFLSEILLENGYNTYAVGKWHLTPGHESSAAVPFEDLRGGTRTITVDAGAEGPRPVTIVLPEGYRRDRAWPLVYALQPSGERAERWAEQVRRLLGERARDFVIASPEYRQNYIAVRPPFVAEHALILDSVARIVHIDANRVYASGYSKGGFAAWHVTLYFADRFAGTVALDQQGLLFR